MKRVGEVCDRNFICVSNETSVLTAIRLMRQSHRCSVISVDPNSIDTFELSPLGIVSDSEIVAEVYATGLDPRVITLGDLLVAETPRLSQTDDLSQAIGLMQNKGLDHLLVVDQQGHLVGSVSRKDLFNIMTEKHTQQSYRT